MVQLSVNAEVKALASARLANGESAARLEALLFEHRRGETNVRQASNHGRSSIEIRGAWNRSNDSGRDVLEHSTHRVRLRVLAGNKRGRSHGPLLRCLQRVDLGLQLCCGHVLCLEKNVVHLLRLHRSEGGGAIIL